MADQQMVWMPVALIQQAALYIESTPTAPGVAAGVPMSLLKQLETAANASLAEQKAAAEDGRTPEERAKIEAAAQEAEESLRREAAATGSVLLRKRALPPPTGNGGTKAK